MLAYVVLSAVTAPLGRVPIREGLRRFGYVFLPLELGCAFIAFGDDALQLFRVSAAVARVLLLLGFVWSLALAVPIVRRATATRRHALLAFSPIAAALAGITWLWARWYA